MSIELPPIDDLIEMGKNDPEQLERLRLQLIEDLIKSSPEHTRRRLRGIQFQVDMEVQKHQSQMGRCIAISRMMHEQLLQLQQALTSPSDPTLNKQSSTTEADSSKQSASIIPIT